MLSTTKRFKAAAAAIVIFALAVAVVCHIYLPRDYDDTGQSNLDAWLYFPGSVSQRAFEAAGYLFSDDPTPYSWWVDDAARFIWIFLLTAAGICLLGAIGIFFRETSPGDGGRAVNPVDAACFNKVRVRRRFRFLEATRSSTLAFVTGSARKAGVEHKAWSVSPRTRQKNIHRAP